MGAKQHNLMKPHFDDPTFTAWLLGEATPEQTSAWEQALREDAAVQREREEAQAFISMIERSLSDCAPVLDVTQRDKVLSMARSRDATDSPNVVVTRGRRRWIPWTLATAALAMMGLWLGSQYPVRSRVGDLSYSQVSREIALLPSDDGGFPHGKGPASEQVTAVGGSNLAEKRHEMWQRQPSEFLRFVAQRVAEEPLPQSKELPKAVPRQFVEASDHPVATLPTRVGMASWSWVKRAALEQGQKPASNLVRLEEWIQAFPLQSGLSQEADGLSLRAAILPAASSSNTVVVLSLTNQSKASQSVEWSYMAPSLAQYRLIGFASAVRGGLSSRLLAPGEKVQVMIEIKNLADATFCGQVSCRSQGREFMLPLSLSAIATQDADFYRLLLLVAANLQGQKADLFVIRALIEKLEQQHLTPERAEAIGLMKRWF
jgi:hypothetical protein